MRSSPGSGLAKAFCAAGLSAALFWGGPSGAASAQVAGPGDLVEAHQDWVVRCPAAQAATPATTPAAVPRCEAVQDVRRRDGDGRRVIGVVVAHDEAGRLQATILAPLGVSLSGGVELFLDAGAVSLARFPFSACQQAGCVAKIPLNEPLLSAFQRGRAIRVRVRTDEGRSADLPISLRGFTSAHQRLTAPGR